MNSADSKSQKLFSFRVELSMGCPRCDRPVPIDGPVSTAHCKYCQNDIEIEKDYWIEHLRDACSDMQSTSIGRGSGSMLFGTNTGNLTLGRLDPYCDNCKTDFQNPWILEPETSYVCTKCGSQWPVSRPPDWLSKSVPRIKQLVNALIEKEDGEETNLPDSLTSISCPSCAGSLSIDGSSRLVRCSYCDKQVYLPDDLWVRLHGTKRKRRWFVICSYGEKK